MRRGHQLVGVWPERPASAKIKPRKFLLKSLDVVPRKFAPAKISRYTVVCSWMYLPTSVSRLSAWASAISVKNSVGMEFPGLKSKKKNLC